MKAPNFAAADGLRGSNPESLPDESRQLASSGMTADNYARVDLFMPVPESCCDQ
jgi:hypothetical protein